MSLIVPLKSAALQVYKWRADNTPRGPVDFLSINGEPAGVFILFNAERDSLLKFELHVVVAFQERPLRAETAQFYAAMHRQNARVIAEEFATLWGANGGTKSRPRPEQLDLIKRCIEKAVPKAHARLGIDLAQD